MHRLLVTLTGEADGRDGRGNLERWAALACNSHRRVRRALRRNGISSSTTAQAPAQAPFIRDPGCHCNIFVLAARPTLAPVQRPGEKASQEMALRLAVPMESERPVQVLPGPKRNAREVSGSLELL